MKPTVALMVTGGIDSTVLMYEAKQLAPVLLSVSYNQIVWPKQKKLINYHAKILGMSNVKEIKIEYHKWQITKGLFQKGYSPKTKVNPLEDWDHLAHAEFFIEGRNAIMLLYAMAYCSKKKIDELWVGYEYEVNEWANSRSFKMITDDTSPHFVDILNLLAITGFSHRIRIRAPFYERRMDKRDIIRRARQLEIDLDQTYSCYFIPECGKCDNCILKREAFASLDDWSDK